VAVTAPGQTILPPGPMPSVTGAPPVWHPVRYAGISPRETALRVVIGMSAPVLRRLGAFHPINQSLTSIMVRWTDDVFLLRSAAQAVRDGDACWSEPNASLCLARLRNMRRAHSAAIRVARDLAALDAQRAAQRRELAA